jgi:phage baseplate assembly protein W
MKSFYIDPNTNDLVFDGQNNLAMVDGDDELVQCIRDIVTTNLGEWFLDPTHGFPRFRVLGEKFDRDRITDELVAAILQESRVQSVEEVTFDFDRKTRILHGTFRVKKRSGEVVEGRF